MSDGREQEGLILPFDTDRELSYGGLNEWHTQELWALIAVEIQRFTMGESTSVRTETAEEIARSVLFSLRQYEQMTEEKTENLPLTEALRKGRMAVSALVETGKKLLALARRTAWSADNRSYLDTIREIGSFFKKYDIWHGAHDVPCMIDYQLLLPVEEREGILFINRYLQQLIWENLFCRSFMPERLLDLYRAWAPDYRELLINLCEPALANALGRLLAGKSPEALQIEEADRGQIARRLFSLKQDEIVSLFQEEARKLCQMTGLPEQSWGYFIEAARGIGIRAAVARHGTGMENLFVTIK